MGNKIRYALLFASWIASIGGLATVYVTDRGFPGVVISGVGIALALLAMRR